MLKWRKQDVDLPIKEVIENQQFKSAAVKIETPIIAADGQDNVVDWYVRPAMILTSFALFCGLMFNAGSQLWSVLDQPIQVLSVSGSTQFIDKEQFKFQLIAKMRQMNGNVSVLSTKINEIQHLAVEDPWVNNAVIKRQWPPSISIVIEEQVAVAKWGKKGLLNHQGDVFWAEHGAKLDLLPILNGPSTDTARVMDKYHTLSRFFKGTDSFMLGLSLQARGAWTLLLDNNIEVELGREQVLARLRRFLELYKGHLYLRAKDILKVDVRYTNGVAVQWRAENLDALEAIEKQ